MAAGTDTASATWGAVPTDPNTGFTITQQLASTAIDIVTIKAASSGTGSWLVLANSAGTAQMTITKNAGIGWKVRTTRPTTGLVKGEMFIAFHGSTPKICICTSTAAQTVKQVRARTKTFGRLTA